MVLWSQNLSAKLYIILLSLYSDKKYEFILVIKMMLHDRAGFKERQNVVLQDPLLLKH